MHAAFALNCAQMVPATPLYPDTPQALHIGIVGCSAEGAALCYRTLCAEGAEAMGPHAHPEISLHTLPLADYVVCLERGDLHGVAQLMLRSARKLAAAGADFLICPDNTIHQALHLVLPESPRPWLHIADEGGGRGRAARLPPAGRHRHPLAGRQRGVPAGAGTARPGMPVAQRGRAR